MRVILIASGVLLLAWHIALCVTAFKTANPTHGWVNVGCITFIFCVLAVLCRVKGD